MPKKGLLWRGHANMYVKQYSVWHMGKTQKTFFICLDVGKVSSRLRLSGRGEKGKCRIPEQWQNRHGETGSGLLFIGGGCLTYRRHKWDSPAGVGDRTLEDTEKRVPYKWWFELPLPSQTDIFKIIKFLDLNVHSWMDSRHLEYKISKRWLLCLA